MNENTPAPTFLVLSAQLEDLKIKVTIFRHDQTAKQEISNAVWKTGALITANEGNTVRARTIIDVNWMLIERLNARIISMPPSEWQRIEERLP